jgi:hypothetical protein
VPGDLFLSMTARILDRRLARVNNEGCRSRRQAHPSSFVLDALQKRADWESRDTGRLDADPALQIECDPSAWQRRAHLSEPTDDLNDLNRILQYQAAGKKMSQFATRAYTNLIDAIFVPDFPGDPACPVGHEELLARHEPFR